MTKTLELGRKSEYESTYNPEKLFPISRIEKRIELGFNPIVLPFWGFDSWNHYEVSWLNPSGKPIVAIAEILYDCHSPNIIESKSFKLYFNSFNNSSFDSLQEVERIIKQDLSQAVGAEVTVSLAPLGKQQVPLNSSFAGESLDDLDVACVNYSVAPFLLKTEEGWVEETLHSDLLKSNCLVTFQPDWGSVQIHYKGPKINREGLLQYIVSFRNHNEFHEQCIERIFNDILTQCNPEELTVYGRYTRRGGLDINPFRTSVKEYAAVQPMRLIRQ